MCVRVGKIVALWPPIVAFAVAGFEHSIANMAIVGLGVMHGGSSVGLCLYNNLLPVTLGNILGGAVFVGAVLYFLYIYEDDVMTQHKLAGVVVDEHMATKAMIAESKLTATRAESVLSRRKLETLEQADTASTAERQSIEGRLSMTLSPMQYPQRTLQLQREPSVSARVKADEDLPRQSRDFSGTAQTTAPDTMV